MVNQSGQRKTILTILLASALLIGSIIYYISNIQQAVWHQAVVEILEVTAQGSHAFEVYIEKDMQILSRIVKYLSNTDSTDQDGIFDAIDLFEDAEIAFTVLDLESGQMYENKSDRIYPVSADALEQYRTLAGRGIREPYTDEYTGQQVVGSYQYLTFADGAAGIVQAKRPMSVVAEEFMLSFYNDTGFSYIVNREGDILIRPCRRSAGTFSNILEVVDFPGSEENDLVTMLKNSIAQNGEGAVRLPCDGVESVLAFTPINGTDGWSLVTIVPDNAVMNHADDILKSSQTFMILSGSVIAIAVLFIYMGRRSYLKLLKKEDDVQYREHLFSILANNTNDVFLMFSPDDFSVEYVSPNIERVLGISPEEVRADIHILERHLPDGSYHHITLSHLKEDCSIVYEGERIHKISGDPCWFLETIYKTSINGSNRFVAVLSDRTHEQQSERALKSALEIARTANESKSMFLSNMSHDIRTPMNAIIGFSTLLRRDANNPAKVREYTHKIASSSQHLLGLINDVLDMSKIESGKTTLNITEISLAKIVDELDTMMQPQARSRHQQFKISVHDICNEEVLGDRLRINQILINILSNAVKYTPEGGKIQMTVCQLPQCTRHYARFRFIIEDNGIGMTKEYLETIFQPFSRETTDKTLGIQGTGLGMAITHNLVNLMGGTIQVESELNRGSKFTIELELRTKEQDTSPDFWTRHGISRLLIADDEEDVCLGIQNVMSGSGVEVQYALGGQAAIQMVQAAQQQGTGYDLVLCDWQMPDISGIEAARHIRQIVPSTVPILILTAYDIGHLEKEGADAGINGYLQKPFFLSNFKMAVSELMGGEADKDENAADNAGDALSGLHILAAEDNDLNAEILTELLEMSGASCDIAKNGQLALERFEQSAPGQYDLILMDVQMPVMNGYEATRAIRKCSHPEAKSIPIIAMTANAFSEDVKEALDAGMNRHVAKPIDMDHLSHTIRDLLSSSVR